MYFLGVKSTAHPPIIGALGHSTDFICGPRLTKVDPSGPKWTKLDPCRPKWTQVDQDRPKWTQMDPSGPMWTRDDICHKHHKQRLCKIITTRVKFYFVDVF